MKKQTVISKKRRGPAPTGIGMPALVRLQPDMATAIDNWRNRQEDTPGRPEAIRRLVELGLQAEPRPVHSNVDKALKAMDAMTDELGKIARSGPKATKK